MPSRARKRDAAAVAAVAAVGPAEGHELLAPEAHAAAAAVSGLDLDARFVDEFHGDVPAPTKNPACEPGFFDRGQRGSNYSASTLTKVCFSAPFFENFTRPGLRANSVWSVPMPTFGAGAHRGAALTDQDVAGEHGLAAELLHAQALAVRFAAVTSTAACLFMCHVS
jgi:hypothetical protein